MNPHYTDFRFPSIKKMSWSKVLGGVGGEEGARSAKDAQDLEDAKDLVSTRGWVEVGWGAACGGLRGGRELGRREGRLLTGLMEA